MILQLLGYSQVILQATVDMSKLNPDNVSVEWRWNQQPLDETDSRKFERNGRCFSLRIKGVRTEDNGQYSCTVVTPNQSETKSCLLMVEGESLM
jgi:hypothetical protein